MFFTTSIYDSTLRLYTICQILVFLCLQASFSSRIDKDLRILSKLLPGYYSNQHQYILDVVNKVPSKTRHLSLQTVIRPVNIPFLENSFDFYIEQYVNQRRNKPFKQWLYSFNLDYQGRAIRMKNILFRDPEKLKSIHKNIEYIQDLKESDVYSRKNCDMLWRRLKKKFFHGATGRDCVAYVNKEKVRVEMSATLDSKSLKWQEGWFKVSDGSKTLATEGPYEMKKTHKINTKEYKQSTTRQDDMALKLSDSISGHSNNVGIHPGRNSPLRNHVPISDGISTNPPANIWNLDSFEEILEKLMLGRKVSMVIDATQCSKSGYPTPHRFYFGMEIDNFEISLDKRKFHGQFLKVSSLKKVLHNNDIYQILREVKLFKDGTVVVDFYVLDHFSNHVTQQSMAICRIYNSKTKNGHVKFTSDPFKYVKTVKSFGSLRSSLRKGRETKMVINLSKCSHEIDKTTIIGGKLKDYDFLDSGNTIAATFSSLQSNSETENIITSENAFAAFSHDNRLTLTIKYQNIAKNFSDFFINKTLKYRCNISKNSKKYGLSLFHS